MRTGQLLICLALGVAAPGLAQMPAAGDRPAADTARDADRKPAEMVAFAGIKPGDKVADIIPGGGYFTRVFSKAVGPKGMVFAVVPAALAARNPKAADGVTAIAAEPAYKNVTVAVVPFAQVPMPGLLDVAWTSQNYHDMYNNDPQVAATFAADMFKALRPGGHFIVVDHAAAPGTDAATAKPLHRIDPALVKAQVVAAGFVFEGESKAIANPADPHDKAVFDPAIRGHTDQFALKFRKPG
jgi:predicted methyltransferase